VNYPRRKQRRRCMSIRVTIQFETGNDAFQDDMLFEFRRILEQTTRIVEDPTIKELSLLDTNGNTVGTVKVERWKEHWSSRDLRELGY
jgi:hypothetical protein